MMKAKIINGEIAYSSDYMIIGDNWVSNPNEEMIANDGYKDINF